MHSQPQSSPLLRGLPAWTYFHQELLELEYESMILPSWQYVCHSQAVSRPGDYSTLALLHDPLVVIRGEDGRLRGFLNACRHRGFRLLEAQGRCTERILCRYHGWSYWLDGSLAKVPSPETFPGLQASAHGLVPIEVEELFGLVFARVIPGGPSLREQWGETLALVEPYQVETMTASPRGSSERWNCNWKIAVDNNLENYHVPLGHPGYHRLLDADPVGQLNPHGVAVSKAVLRERLSARPTERLYQTVVEQALPELPEPHRRTWLFVTLQPNLGLNFYPEGMDVFQILPDTATTCISRTATFRRAGDHKALRAMHILNLRINRQVGAEDKFLCERVQETVQARGYRPGPLSSLEFCLADFHRRLRTTCPVAGLGNAPEAGTLRRVNAALLSSSSAWAV